jgi:hypothetical protein
MGSLKQGWLSVELNSITKEVGEWTDGLKESYESLLAQSTKASEDEDRALSTDAERDQRQEKRRA